MSPAHRFQLNKLNTEVEASEFIAWCCNRLGYCFHPDTHFNDYEETGGGKFFVAEEVEMLEKLMSEAFQLLDDPYDVALRMPPFESVSRS